MKLMCNNNRNIRLCVLLHIDNICDYVSIYSVTGDN